MPWDSRARVTYGQLVPELAGFLAVASGGEAASFSASILAGIGAALLLIVVTVRYQWGRWCQASPAPQ